MTTRTAAAGWVVQLTILGVAAEGTKSAAFPGSTFQFFNVAVGSADQAIEAARKSVGAPNDAPMRVVRALSSSEIAALKLRAGQVKPA
jgi:hypothetical protein